MELPTDRPRPAERDPRGALVPIRIPVPLAEQVIALGRRHEASPFMTLLTAFSALLARYSGQWDVSVGVPVAGRNQPETEPVVGFFINSLVMRCRLDPDLSFSQALDRVRDTSLAAFARQQVSFEHLVEELRPDRDLSRTPLYQVAFNFNDAQVSGGLPGDTDYDLLVGSRQVSKTDLTLYLRTEDDGELVGVVEYATSLFERGTVERFARHFVQLLTAAVDTSESRLSTLDIVPAQELGDVTERWNATRTEWDAGSVIDLFEAQADKTPPMPSPWWRARRASPTGTWTARPTGSRTGCARWGRAPTPSSACASTAARTSSAPCSASGRRARRTCRSTPPTRPSGWGTSWRTAGRRSW
ncbi:hypothetical protein GCM10020000_12850 [Streptomyces olivoverticillatus]